MIHNIGDLIALFENDYADRIAFRWVDSDTEEVRAVSYGQFVHDIRSCITKLQNQIGSLEGKHVSLLARNSYPFIVNMFSILSMGCVLVPLNLQKSKDEILYELGFSDTSLVFHDGEFFEREGEFGDKFFGQIFPLITSFDEKPFCGNFCRNNQAFALLLFTSGTTGRSKGVMLSQRSILRQAEDEMTVYRQILRNTGHDEHEHVNEMSVLPLYHAACGRLFMRLWEGNTVQLCTNLKYLYRDLQKMPSESIEVVPVIMKTLHRDVVRGKADRLGKIRTIVLCAAMVNESIMQDMLRHGYFLANIYGLTETFACTHNISQELDKLKSIGKCDPGYEVMIDQGELCFRGDGIMLGYYHDPEATKQLIDDSGWVHTGDLASMDEEGNIFLTGRKKNLIILESGENVSPEELEAFLEECPDIKECVVKECQGKVTAEVYTEEGSPEVIAQFIKTLNERLPLYKQIAQTIYRDTPFERTATGKIIRKYSIE